MYIYIYRRKSKSHEILNKAKQEHTEMATTWNNTKSQPQKVIINRFEYLSDTKIQRQRGIFRSVWPLRSHGSAQHPYLKVIYPETTISENVPDLYLYPSVCICICISIESHPERKPKPSDLCSRFCFCFALPSSSI